MIIDIYNKCDKSIYGNSNSQESASNEEISVVNEDLNVATTSRLEDRSFESSQGSTARLQWKLDKNFGKNSKMPIEEFRPPICKISNEYAIADEPFSTEELFLTEEPFLTDERFLTYEPYELVDFFDTPTASAEASMPVKEPNKSLPTSRKAASPSTDKVIKLSSESSAKRTLSTIDHSTERKSPAQKKTKTTCLSHDYEGLVDMTGEDDEE